MNFIFKPKQARHHFELSTILPTLLKGLNLCSFAGCFHLYKNQYSFLTSTNRRKEKKSNKLFALLNIDCWNIVNRSQLFPLIVFIDGFADIIAIIFYDDFNGERIIAVFLVFRFRAVHLSGKCFQFTELTKTKYLSIIDILIKICYCERQA